MDRTDILAVVLEALEVHNSLNPDAPLKTDVKARLFGEDAPLDSLMLVSFLVEIEERLDARFEHAVVLTSESAFSLERSPYRTVESLVEFIESKESGVE